MSCLHSTTSPRARAATGTVLVVPLGATEQHGPHLPLTTDTDIAVALAQGLERASDGIVLAPALPYGSSGEHQSFPGTLSIGAEATAHVLTELCRSATLTWPRVLLLCAHGGNAAPLACAVARASLEGRDVRAWSPSWPSGDLHAGHTETSLMLALAAERVDEDAMADAKGTNLSLHALLEPMRRGGVAAVSPNGVLGDPRSASAEEGHAFLAAAVDTLVTLVQEWRRAPVGEPL